MKEATPQEMASYAAMDPGTVTAQPIEEVDGEQKRRGQMQEGGAGKVETEEECSTSANTAEAPTMQAPQGMTYMQGQGYAEPQQVAAPQTVQAQQAYAAPQAVQAQQAYAAPQAVQAQQAYAAPQEAPVQQGYMAGNVGDPSYLHLGTQQYQYMYQPQPTVTGGFAAQPTMAQAQPVMPQNGYAPNPAYMAAMSPEQAVAYQGYMGMQRPEQPQAYANGPVMGRPMPQQPWPVQPGMPQTAATGMAGYAYAAPSMEAPQASAAFERAEGPQAQPSGYQGPPTSNDAAKGHGNCNCNHGKEEPNPAGQAPWQDFGQVLGNMFGADGSFQGANLLGAAFGGMPGFNPGASAPQTGSVDPKHLEERYGQMFELYSDLMQGKTDPAKIASFISSSSGNFWKGAIVGALLTFIMTNSSIKSTLAESFSSIFGKAKPE